MLSFLLFFYFICVNAENQISIGIAQKGKAPCYPNGVELGTRKDFATPTNPLHTEKRLKVCIYSTEEQTPFRLDASIADHMIGYFETFDGAQTTLTFDGETVVCKNVTDCKKYSQIYYLELQCVEDGGVNTSLSVFLPETGMIYEFFAVYDCKKLYWNQESGNWAHTFESLPLNIYLSFKTVGFLLNWRFKSRRSKTPKFVQENGDNIALLLLGLGVSISQYAIDGMVPDDEFNYMHIQLGFFLISVSLLGMCVRSSFREKIVNFSIPFILLYIGIMFFFHVQVSMFAYMTHRAFGLSALATATLFGVMQSYPKFTVVAYMSAQLTTAILFSSGHYVIVKAEQMHLHAMNYLFWVVNIVIAWNAFLLLIALCLNRCSSRSGVSHYIELKEKKGSTEFELQHLQ